MTGTKFVFSITTFLFIGLFSFVTSFAQTETKSAIAATNYEITLQVLAASNDATGTMPVPKNLSNVVKKLRETYSFSNFRLASTHFQRISNSVEYRGVLNGLSQDTNNTAPTFAEWSLIGLQDSFDSGNRNSIQFQSFRFGARVPIRTSTFRDAEGKESETINYEQIGLTISRIGLPVTAPTIIGTLSTSKPAEMLFLILTVNRAEE
jgi:hypothetical protein